MAKSESFPGSADAVIIGVGGIVGSSLAHFLTELGVRNIVGLEKAGVIPSDIASTAHASDLSIAVTAKPGCGLRLRRSVYGTDVRY